MSDRVGDDSGFVHGFSELAGGAEAIVAALGERDRRVLLYGPPGIGKSTLAAQLARTVAQDGRECHCVCADPGSPAFGVPGAVVFGRWRESGWETMALEAMCSLDAGRFRLPLVTAVRRLASRLNHGVLLIDSPGVVRGVAGRELLWGLIEAAAVDVVLALSDVARAPPLLEELRALGTEIFVIPAAPEAMRPGKRARARQRSALWDAYLANAREHALDLDTFNLLGTPPPVGEPSAWPGRQIALLHGQRTVAMGEVQRLEAGRMIVRLPGARTDGDSLLVRDARRSSDGLIETAVPFAAERIEYLPPVAQLGPLEESGGPRVAGRAGGADFCLLNGVFGDPLLHLRLRHERRSLLFDLGDGVRLPARIAHQVTDVFITHAHLDHIGGFLWLVRSRIGEFPPCRVYGPPGLAEHIAGFLRGILWDRVLLRGPVFEVLELHERRLQRFRLQAGREGREALGDLYIEDGVVLREPGFRIRAVQLDHHTPVLAYAFEPDREISIRKDRLAARGWAPGPWLGELKQRLLNDDLDARIRLPDGSECEVAMLAAELVLITPPKRLVYATDLADHAENRARLQAFARHAHTFFCEACFIESHAEQAARTGHLTTRACGEIATAAEVVRLVPFHFSRRYADAPQRVYDEIAAVCPRLILPRALESSET
ncbi:MAG: Clp1/GlmU family protein [Pseudomonadota bacterium]